MPSPLDTRIGVGKESTYGTAVAPTRHYEARSDPWAQADARIDSSGFRQSRQAQRADRDTKVTMGATGSIETAFYTSGMGLLLEDLLGSNVAPSQIGSTGVYNQVFRTNTDGPDSSLTVQVVRVLEGTEFGFDYAGCLPTGFNIGVSQGEALMLSIEYDARSEAKQASPTAGVYPAGAVPFIWEECSITVDGASVDTFQSFSLDGALQLATDLHFLKASALKDQPRRMGVPTYTGALEGIPKDLGLFDQYDDADLVPIVFSASNGQAGAALRSVTVSMPACKLTGSTPSAQLDGLTTQSSPFTVYHNGTDSAVTITVQTPDATF